MATPIPHRSFATPALSVTSSDFEDIVLLRGAGTMTKISQRRLVYHIFKDYGSFRIGNTDCAFRGVGQRGPCGNSAHWLLRLSFLRWCLCEENERTRYTQKHKQTNAFIAGPSRFQF